MPNEKKLAKTEDSTSREKLSSYIRSLTPDQAEAVIRHLPRLIESLSAALPPYPPEQS